MYPRALQVYIGLVCLAASMLLAWSTVQVIHSVAVEPWIPCIVLSVMVFITAVFPVRFIRGNGWASVQLPVLVASSVILGPAMAAWVKEKNKKKKKKKKKRKQIT
jgi:accessory gene regulator protein AgrB